MQANTQEFDRPRTRVFIPSTSTFPYFCPSVVPTLSSSPVVSKIDECHLGPTSNSNREYTLARSTDPISISSHSSFSNTRPRQLPSLGFDSIMEQPLSTLHSQMNHSVVCPEQGPGTVSRGHSWLHQDNASSPQDESTMMATVDNLDYPPVSYIAETIAKELMVDGDQMFNRMSDATCILVVGNARYYVHVQMLASRSPTFRDIFDEMIASGAWDMTSTSSSSGEESSSSDILSDNGDGDCHMNDAPTSRSVDHLDVTMDDNSGPRSVPNTVNTQSGRSYTNNTTAANIDLRADAESLNTQLIRPLHIFSIKPSMVYGFDSENEGATEGSTDGSDIDDDSTLPTLTIALSDPTGTHIEELLYWIYTGNKERWLMSFNVDNYRFILNNILYLRLATEEVVTVCKEFEDSVGTSLGIQGLAQQVLRKKLG